MSPDEAKKTRVFKNSCTCGGYAWSLNGRPESQPHMRWCPQYDEYGEWWRAMKSGNDGADDPSIETRN